MAIDPDVETRLIPIEAAISNIEASLANIGPDQLRASHAFQAKLFAILATSNDPTAIWQKLSDALDQG